MNLDYKGIQVFYADQGQGDVIVLLHGFLENASMWDTLLPSLIPTHRVITIDLLGHGQTESLGYIHTMDDIAKQVKAVLDHLNIESSTIIGHSMGGYVALAFAKNYPDDLSGLCLMNSTFEADDEERKILRSRANKMVQHSYETLVRTSFTNLFSESSRERYKDQLNSALNDALKTTPQGYCAAQEGMILREDTLEVFKNLSCKRLIIIGEKDWVVDREVLQQKLKNTDIKTVTISEGHMSHIENFEDLSYNIVQFIEK